MGRKITTVSLIALALGLSATPLFSKSECEMPCCEPETTCCEFQEITSCPMEMVSCETTVFFPLLSAPKAKADTRVTVSIQQLALIERPIPKEIIRITDYAYCSHPEPPPSFLTPLRL